ncbi:MAG: hypothetical protein HOO86_02265 [Bacteroidales bacterium]|nr:hypothetical protein [Bacteroidales bacterium]
MQSIQLVGLLLFLFPVDLFAQFYNGSNMSFGKSRVQWNNTIWTYYRFADFDTYFYLNGNELALYTAKYATEQIPVLEKRLQAALNQKIQFIVFNNLSDLKQSNIGLASEQQYNLGGITHIIGTKVFIYFDGNYLHFEQQIRAGIAEMLLNNLMYGSSIGSQIRNTTVFNLPDWYKTGLLSYISEDWNTLLDDRLRDGITSGRFKKLNRLKGEDAIIAGHSLWQYIEDKYGKSAMADIVHMTQMSRNVQKGFLYVTGLKYSNLIKEWYLYYRTIYVAGQAKLPANELRLKYRTYRTFERPTLSPDNKHLCYTTNDEGLMKLWLIDLQTDKKKKMFRSGYSSDALTDYTYPLTTWHPGGRLLAFVVEEKGKIFLYFYNLDDESIDKRNMFDFQKITHISYSPDGRSLAMSAVRNGKPDIYIFDIAANSHRQVTNDFYTDLTPVFTDGHHVVFSSNRSSDTLSLQLKPENQPPHFDLFSFETNGKSNIAKRLTNTPAISEILPSLSKANNINYLSDENGVYNLYNGRFDSVISFVDTTVHYRYFMESSMVTNFTSNILYYTGSDVDDSFFIQMQNNNKQKLYKLNEDEIVDTEDVVGEITPFRLKQQLVMAPDTSLAVEKKKGRKSFYTMFRPHVRKDTNQYIPLPTRQGAFGIKGNSRLTSLLYEASGEKQARFGQGDLPKRRNYYVEYFYDQLISQVDFTYTNYNYQTFAGGGAPIYLNPGFNVLMGVTLTDLLEDYRIVGGVRLNPELINNEYAVSFSNLKHRLDRQITLHRQSIENVGITEITRTHSHQAYYMLSWPFTETLGVRGTGIFRNDMKVYLSTDAVNLKKQTEYENWGGFRAELVLDNSREIGTNLYTGIRSKVFAEYYQLITKNSRNFVVLGFDFRHYQRIHRNFIWANRLAASTSFGSNKLIYYMGGVDNWLAASFNQETPIDYTQNYAYQTLATNMRGFNQNIRNGNNFAVINTELRFPVFSYFLQNPISSNFIRNLQLTAFGDLGTAWTGWNPYSPENSLYTKYIHNGPLTISVEIQKDPLVAGMGFGARTTILGYFVRGDVAWGVEDGKIARPVYYLSLNLDF